MNKRAKLTTPNPSPNSFMRQSERNASRTRSPRGRSPSDRMSRWPCKDYLRGTCNNSFCEKWHPPECLFYKTKSGCRFGEKCSYAHRQVDEQPSKRYKKNGAKSAVAMLKENEQNYRTGRPRCISLFIKYTTIGMRIPGYGAAEVFIYFTEELRHTENRSDVFDSLKPCYVMLTFENQNPSLGMICPGEPHQRNPNAPKFEDRSQEETEWQERGAREAASRLAKSVLKLKDKKKAAFFSPSEKGACLHQILNLRKENVLSTPERQCI